MFQMLIKTSFRTSWMGNQAIARQIVCLPQAGFDNLIQLFNFSVSSYVLRYEICTVLAGKIFSQANIKQQS
jgi:hypothetical protein